MNRCVHLLLPALIVTGVSCSSSSASKPTTTPAPAPAPAPAPTTTVVEGGRGAGAAGAPGQPGGRAALTPEQRAVRRDSIAKLRTESVQQVLASIAGRENEPAGTVFNNVVTVLKDMPAGDFVRGMDQNFGRALSMNCTSCHVAGAWDDDSRNAKKTARIMIAMVNALNTEQLSKLPPNRSGKTPTVTCVTCHRGNGNPGTALVP